MKSNIHQNTRKVCEGFDEMQTNVYLIDLVISFPTSIWLRTLASIQPRARHRNRKIWRVQKLCKSQRSEIRNTKPEDVDAEGELLRDFVFGQKPAQPVKPSLGLCAQVVQLPNCDRCARDEEGNHEEGYCTDATCHNALSRVLPMLQ